MSSPSVHISNFCIRRRKAVLAAIIFCTVLLAFFAIHIQIKTVFTDMLPLDHPWVQISQKYKNTFGGVNKVTIMVKASQGTIFQPEVLRKIQSVTRELRTVTGINASTITSIASGKLKTVEATSTSVKTIPLMASGVPETPSELKTLKARALSNPLVYGGYVSKDLKSALITANFVDRLVDYTEIFPQVRSILKRNSGPEVQMYAVGQPMLYGWVRHYLPQTIFITVITIALLAIVLFLLTRSFRGTLFPLLAGGISAIWSLGIAELLGLNFDPLMIVVAFLISARSISHSVQQVTRFDDLIAKDPAMSSIDAARESLRELFRPGSVGVLADAAAILVVLLTPIPLLQKISIIGAIWVSTIFVSAIMMTPILLSWVKRPGRFILPLNLAPGMHWVLEHCVRISVGKSRYFIVGGAVVLFLVSGVLALQVDVGDTHDGSPILRPGSVYNTSAAKINASFPGANSMYVVVHGEDKDAVKEPDVLKTIALFQRQMRTQPEVGGATSLADVISATNQSLHGGNPRFYGIGNSAMQNGQFLYVYFSHSARSDIKQYADLDYQNAAVKLFFHNHTGQTIRTAFHHVQQFIDQHPLKNASYQLAGGMIGVMAAVNDVLLRGQMEAIALGLLVVVLCAMLVYRSTVAGMFFMIPVLLSNTVTFAYMTIHGIGLNINTVPVVALGIGLGVDYSFYIADGIREEINEHGNVLRAMKDSLHSAGRGVLITGLTLVVTVFVWAFSSLRFQAEMATLIALWLTVSAVSALVVMPALAYIFRPKFIFSRETANSG